MKPIAFCLTKLKNINLDIHASSKFPNSFLEYLTNLSKKHIAPALGITD